MSKVLDKLEENNSPWGEHEWSPSSSCWDISLKNKNVNLTVVREERSADHQSHQDAPSEHHECLHYKVI